MKLNLIFLSLFAFFVTACNTDNTSKPEKEVNTITSLELTVQEEEFVNKLLDVGTISQEELMLEMGKLDNFSQNTLKKLDMVLEIDCIEVSNQCSFTSKV